MSAEKQPINKLSGAPQDTRVLSGSHILPFAVGTVLVTLLIATYYASLWRSLAEFSAAIDSCEGLFCDFARFYYPMGASVFQTGLPLKGFVYSPFIAILLALFSPLCIHASVVLWGVLQIAAIVVYFLLFRWLVPAGLFVQLLFVGLTLTCFPLLHNLTWGQVGIFTTVAILGALASYQQGHRVAAAAILAFGISFKFFPLIFLVPFAIRRDFRFLLITAAACCVLLLVIPGALIGVEDTMRFYAALLESYRHFDWVINNYNSQHFPHVLLRLADIAGWDLHAYLPLLRGIAYSVMAASLTLILLIQRACLRHAHIWSFHILFLSVPFILNTSWPVDLVYIPFGQALLTWQLLEGRSAALEKGAGEDFSRKDAWRIWKSPRRVIAAILLLLSIVISNIVFFNLYDDRLHYGSYGFIFWADLLLLLATYLEFLPSALRQIRAQARYKTLSSTAMSEASASK